MGVKITYFIFGFLIATILSWTVFLSIDNFNDIQAIRQGTYYNYQDYDTNNTLLMTKEVLGQLQPELNHLYYNVAYVEDTLGTYDKYFDSIVVYGFDADSADTLRHEIGHRVWYKVLTKEERDSWEQLYENVSGVSNYAGTGIVEDFAETFECYYNERIVATGKFDGECRRRFLGSDRFNYIDLLKNRWEKKI